MSPTNSISCLSVLPPFSFLFKTSINVVVGDIEERRLLTGLHTVADIHCKFCDTVLGWKYVRQIPQTLFNHLTYLSIFKP